MLRGIILSSIAIGAVVVTLAAVWVRGIVRRLKWLDDGVDEHAKPHGDVPAPAYREWSPGSATVDIHGDVPQLPAWKESDWLPPPFSGDISIWGGRYTVGELADIYGTPLEDMWHNPIPFKNPTGRVGGFGAARDVPPFHGPRNKPAGRARS